MAAASMGFPERSRIRSLTWCCMLLLFACAGETSLPPVDVPNVWVSQDHPAWVESQGILFLEGTPFSGWQYLVDPQGDTLFIGGFVEGRREGRHESRYPDGQLQELRYFTSGRQDGMVKKWHRNGRKSFEARLVQDQYEGTVRSWFANGQPYEEFNYQDGKEEGRQKRWDEAGKVLANYEVRRGRKYGLSGTKNCSSPWDSLGVRAR